MVSQTFTANAFSAAWLIGTATVFPVLLPGALSHIWSPSLIIQLDASLLARRNDTMQWG
jgi:hypothetical protein